jgi:hypothetical protein
MSPVRRNAARHAIWAAVCMVVLAAAGCSTSSTETKFQLGKVQGASFGNALEAIGSHTAADWAAGADAVAIVSVTHEEAREPAKLSTSVDADLIGRNVTLSVDEVLWTSPELKDHRNVPTLPDSFTTQKWGWTKNDGVTTEFMTRNSSRVERGHTYIAALGWIPKVCGEEPEDAKWAIIGSGGALPYDDQTIGVGEFNGEPHKSIPPGHVQPESLLKEAMGLKAADVVEKIVKAEGEKKRDVLANYRNLCDGGFVTDLHK